MSDFCQKCGQAPRGVTHVCPPLGTLGHTCQPPSLAGITHPFDDGPQWTLAQAEELVLEQFASLLDGCDDDDVVRPEMVFEALKAVWNPNFEGEWVEMTAGQMRTRIAAARSRLAARESS